MKQKALWTLLIFILTLGLGAVLYFGVQPRFVEKIRLSSFQDESVASKALLMRLRQELLSEPVLFLGIDPTQESHWKLFENLIQQTQDPALRFHQIWVDQSLESKRFNTVNFVEDPPFFIQTLQKNLESKERVLVVVPLIYASQKVPGSLAQIATQKFHISANSLLIAQVPRSRQDEEVASLPCDVAEADRDGSGKLGCQLLQKARSLYYKKIKEGYLTGYLDQIGSKEFVFALQSGLGNKSSP